MAAAAHGHLHTVFRAFAELSAELLEALPEIQNAPDLDAFHARLRQQMPLAIAASTLGYSLVEGGAPLPEKAREQVIGRRNHVEEVEVRLMDAVRTRIFDIVGDGVGWRTAVGRIRRAAAGSPRDGHRLAKRMVNAEYQYPRVMLPQLLSAAQLAP